MSYTIGQNCMIILDSQGYMIVPESYIIKQPRVRKAQYRADGTLSYVDIGPGKREFHMTILAKNDLYSYDGTLTGVLGESYRDALRTSFAKTAQTIVFQDPIGTSINVYFDDYQEKILDLKSQIISLSVGNPLAASYECPIILLEA
jgi:hypothetical protein